MTRDDAAFTVRIDASCLRGLRYVYTAPVGERPIGEALIARLRGAFPHHLVEDTETWGARVVHRLIVQFRFEIQIGARAGEISFTHRAITSPEQRASDRARFESLLRAARERPEDLPA